MSKPTTEFIDAGSGGKSADSVNPEPSNGNHGAIDAGGKYDFEAAGEFPSPVTRPIGDATGDSAGIGTGSVRRNRDGSVDRRTLRSGNRRTEKEPVSQAITFSIKDTLVSLHMMAAKFFDGDYWELEAEEAEKLSTSIDNVSKHYQVAIDPKKLAIISLMVTLVTIYGPRIMTALAGNAMKKSAAPKPVLVPSPSDGKVKPNGAVSPIPGAPAPRVDLLKFQLSGEPPSGGGSGGELL